MQRAAFLIVCVGVCLCLCGLHDALPCPQRGLRLDVLGIKNPRDMQYDQFADDLPEEEYQEQQEAILNELHRVLKDNGTVWYNHMPRRAGFHQFLPTWIQKCKLNLYGHVIWNKTRG